MQDKEDKGLIAISNVLARSKDGMSMQEKKLLSIYLSKIEWTKKGNSCEVWIEKAELMRLLDCHRADSSDQSVYLKKIASGMKAHSNLIFDGQDKDDWCDMSLITQVRSDKRSSKVLVKFNPDAMALLEGLECEYITLFLSDILKFDSNVDGRRAYMLYEYLRLHSDSRKVNSHVLTTKTIKELFDIPKDGKGSYMQYDARKERDVFNRANFEKYVINPTLSMLSRCEHVVLHNYGKDDNGNPVFYQKVKKGNDVIGYEVSYSINKRPQSVKRETLVDIQSKPEVLKIAQDILDHKKQQSNKLKNSAEEYNSYSQRKYSEEFLSELEMLLLNNQKSSCKGEN